MCLPVFCGLQAALPILWANVLERRCLLEIFVYLEMGGRVDVTLVLAPLDDGFEERFQSST